MRIQIPDHAIIRLRQRIPAFAFTSTPQLIRLIEAGVPGAVVLAPSIRGRRLAAIPFGGAHTVYLVLKYDEDEITVLTVYTRDMADEYCDRVRMKREASQRMQATSHRQSARGRKSRRMTKHKPRNKRHQQDDEEG